MACPSMLASNPASMVNQKPPDLGIPNRFRLASSRFRAALAGGSGMAAAFALVVSDHRRSERRADPRPRQDLQNAAPRRGARQRFRFHQSLVPVMQAGAGRHARDTIP